MLGDTTLQTMMGATFDLASAAENKWLSPSQHVESYERASAAHVKVAERRIEWATRLIYSASERRRDLALYWIKDAKTRVIAAETCLTLATHIDHQERSVIRPWEQNGPGALRQPGIMHRIEILEAFLTKPSKRLVFDDEIPF